MNKRNYLIYFYVFLGIFLSIILGIVSLLNNLKFFGPILLVEISLLFLVINYLRGLRSFLDASNFFILMILTAYGFFSIWSYIRINEYIKNPILLKTYFIVIISIVFYYLGDSLGRILKINQFACIIDKLEKFNENSTRLLKGYIIFATIFNLFIFVLILDKIGGISSLISKLHDRTRTFAGLHTLITLQFIFVKGGLLYSVNTDIKYFKIFFIIVNVVVMSLYGGRSSIFMFVLSLLIYRMLYLKEEPKLIKTLIMLVLLGMILAMYALYFRYILPLRYTLDFSTLFKYIEYSIINNILVSLRQLDIIIQNVPYVYPYIYGKSFIGLFGLFVPRLIWPEKPYGAGGLYSLTFYKESYLEGTGIPPSLIGEFYWNFGIMGVMIGFFFLGLFLRVLYRKATNNSSVIYKAVYSITLANLLIWIRDGTDAPTITWITYVFSFLICYFIINNARLFFGSKS